MSVACLRCGFPNDENAMHCRACSAPLQDTSSDAAIKPRLRQIIAETRARTRARQRRGVSVDPNRVDVVPRLPSGVAASDAALQTALEKGRKARLQGLREELRKGRPDFGPPARQSMPPQNLTLPPSDQISENQQQAEKITPPPAQTTNQIAEQFLDQTDDNPVKVISSKQVPAEPTPLIQPDRKTATELTATKDADEAPQASPELIKPASQTPQLTPKEEPPNSAEVTPSPLPVSPQNEPLAAHAQAVDFTHSNALLNEQPTKDSNPTGPANEIQPEQETANDEVKPVHDLVQLALSEDETEAEPELKPLLSAAAKTALHRLRQAATRLKGKSETSETLEVENACQLYDKKRLLATTVDSMPILTLATLWLSSQFNSGELPPEEIIASWLLGESGGIPWGLLVIGLAWLVWCWVGIAIWGVTPGMKTARLSWHSPKQWQRFARPPLFLVSLIPFGLGGTYALLDKNSRGLSDIILRLTWRRD